MLQICATVFGLALMSAIGASAFASEYGVGTYRPGTVDLFAGMLAAPGGVLLKNYFLFQDVLAQHLPHGLVAGMAGYAVQQTTPDSGSGATLGAFKGRVIGLGPPLGATVPIWSVPISVCFKYDFEFAAQNRSTGNELWLTASVRF